MNTINQMKWAMGEREHLRGLAGGATEISLITDQLKTILRPDAYRIWFLSAFHADNFTAAAKAKLAEELAAADAQEQEAERLVRINEIPESLTEKIIGTLEHIKNIEAPYPVELFKKTRAEFIELVRKAVQS